MKNPYVVLSEKQKEAARVRREIHALLIVIPLLEDEALTWEELKTSLSNLVGPDPEPTEDSMRDVELYFPFTRSLRRAHGTGV
jgi:hypothetical protein